MHPNTPELDDVIRMMDSGHTSRAIEALKQLIGQQPHNDALHYQLGNAYRRQQNWQQALYHYATAHELNPQGPAGGAMEMVRSILDYRCTALINF